MSDVKITRAGWYALTLVSLTYAVSLLDRNIIAILAPRIKQDLAIGDSEMGLLYGTVFALFYALFSLPLGRLADGWIRTRLLGIAVALWSLATGLAAGAQGFALLALSRVGVGVGEGAAIPAGTSIVYDHFPKARRGFAMAVTAAAISLGLGGSLVLGGIVGDWWGRRYAGVAAPWGLHGWQFAFIVAALPGLVLAVLLLRMTEPRRGQMDGIASRPDPRPIRASLAVLGAVLPVSNWVAFVRRGASARDWLINLGGLLLIAVLMGALARIAGHYSPRPSLAFGSLRIDPHVLQWSVVGLGLYAAVNLMQALRHSDPPAYAVMMRSPSLLLCIAIGSLQMVINYGVMGFTPSFVMKSYNLSPATTGLQFGLVAAAIGIIGPLWAGPLSDFMNVKRPGAGRAYVSLAALGLSPLVAVWTYHAPTALGFYLRFTVYGLILTAWLPPLYAIMYEQVLPRLRGVTSSLYIMIYTMCGLGIGPYLVGVISDARGGNLGAAILSVNWVSPVVIVLLLILARRAQRDEDLVVARARAAGEPV